MTALPEREDRQTPMQQQTPSCSAPLLLEGYSSVTLVDIRYLASARLGDFIDFTGSDVLFLYSIPVLNNSETLK